MRANPWLQLQGRGNASARSRAFFKASREIRNRADPREHGAVSSVQHLFCFIRWNAILDSHPDSPGASL